MDILNIVKLVVTGTLATGGFAIFFSIKPKHIPLAVIGGALATLVYAIMDEIGVDLFISNFLASLACVVYSNVLARMLKTPSIVFITASIIPLVPGGSLFYTMGSLILGNTQMAKSYGLSTLKVALGIAGGIVIESLVVLIMTKLVNGKKTMDTE